MAFGKSDQNFGMIALKFTMAMWYTDHKDLRLGQIVYILVFYNIPFS